MGSPGGVRWQAATGTLDNVRLFSIGVPGRFVSYLIVQQPFVNLCHTFYEVKLQTGWIVRAELMPLRSSVIF